MGKITQIFRPVHPRRSATFKGKDLPDSNGVRGNESRFVRCIHCLTINDTEKRPKGDGWGGNIGKTDSGATATKLYKDVVSGAGCWFCGSSNYY